MKNTSSKHEIEVYLQNRLRKSYPSISKRHLEDAVQKMSDIVKFLVDIPLCESAAVGIGFSVKQSSETIAKDNGLDADKICDIIFEASRALSRKSSN